MEQLLVFGEKRPAISSLYEPEEIGVFVCDLWIYHAACNLGFGIFESKAAWIRKVCSIVITSCFKFWGRKKIETAQNSEPGQKNFCCPCHTYEVKGIGEIESHVKISF